MAYRILSALLVALSLSGCGYNTLQETDEQTDAAGSEVLNQYQRRADLIPNLVDLIYVLLAEHAVEIVADHGLDNRVSDAEWQAVCETMDRYFERSEWRAGALAGVEGVTKLAAREFPATDARPDELPNRPVIL